MLSMVKRIFGTQNDRELKRIQPLVNRINDLEAGIKKLSDADLQGKTGEFKTRVANGQPLDELLPEAFAVCREAAWRRLGQRHYDVQLVGGITLHQGKIAEMRTGEGKTLVATLATYLNALSGKGVHVVTVNDYLASRDAEWMGTVYNWLGLNVGTIVHGKNDKQRQQAYGSDITYGTNNEFGFDYLRDNMKFRIEDYAQRDLNFCIVDEVDSILIDEARTPLIISGPTDDSSDKYKTVNAIVPKLDPAAHFNIEEKSKTATLTDEGIARVEELLQVGNLYDPTNIDTLHHVQQAVRAHTLFKKDVDYLIQNGKVVIVDEFTGRAMEGRRWSDGLHQAIEAKENVHIENENQTLASITFQNYFRMYNKLAGMTGTADTEAAEFKSIYNLDVMVIPTHRPVQRIDRNDLIYGDVPSKYKAIIEQIKDCHEKEQPVLVGTSSIESSELLSRALKAAKVTHNVLNAKQHAREASIVSQAGRKGAVTIATNMAGRGTDIKLGGDPEALARDEHEEGSSEFAEALARYTSQCEAEKKEVLDSGGLFILGTERHESRRIDNQLRGRSGRQGDPGESRFYLSLDDELFRNFGGDKIKTLMGSNLGDEPIEHPWLSRAIENAQKKVEGRNYDIRKHVLQYDDVMNMQRKVIYTLRRKILADKEIRPILEGYMEDISVGLAEDYAMPRSPLSDWDFDGLNASLQAVFMQSFAISPDELSDTSIAGLQNLLLTRFMDRYAAKTAELGEYMDEVELMFTLSTIDYRWKEHLLQMDHLREGIGLRGYAQKDPLLEYKKESFYLFQNMQSEIKQETIAKILNVQLRDNEAEAEIERFERQKQKEVDMAMNHGAPGDAAEPMRNEAPKIGRNDPCPCGSGKKYKKCHGK